MGLLDRISKAVGVAITKSSKRLRLAAGSVSQLKSLIGSFAISKTVEIGLIQDYEFPPKIRAKTFLTELKKALRVQGIFVKEDKKKIIEFKQAKISFSRTSNMISIEKIESTIAIKKLKSHEAKKRLRDTYELQNPLPDSSRELRAHNAKVAVFQNKYFKHIMAASNGIKAGLNAIGQKPESDTWDRPINTFLGAYSDYLLKKHHSKKILPYHDFSLTLDSSADANKFKSAFQAEVKNTIRKTKPAHITVIIKGITKTKLYVRAGIKKESHVKMAANETKKRVIR